MKQIGIDEATIGQIHQTMQDGSLTCRGLTRAYLARIKTYDQKGPKLNATV